MKSIIIFICKTNHIHKGKAMYVCLCNAITDRQIKETVAAGASSLTDLQAQLGVATCCGCCADLASSYLSCHHDNLTNCTKADNK
jgi:bacterioferritin-associated ferredoxin